MSRHGKPVAVLLSENDFQSITQNKIASWEMIKKWRAGTNFDENDDWCNEEIAGWRKKKSGRDFSWSD